MTATSSRPALVGPLDHEDAHPSPDPFVWEPYDEESPSASPPLADDSSRLTLTVDATQRRQTWRAIRWPACITTAIAALLAGGFASWSTTSGIHRRRATATHSHHDRLRRRPRHGFRHERPPRRRHHSPRLSSRALPHTSRVPHRGTGSTVGSPRVADSPQPYRRSEAKDDPESRPVYHHPAGEGSQFAYLGE